MMRFIISPFLYSVILGFACIWQVNGQQLQTSLQVFVNERVKHHTQEQVRVKAYLKKVSLLPGNNVKQIPFLLTEISKTGFPVFRAPLNAEVSITTGAARLQNQLNGMNLEGENMLVGVWDDGIVKNHIEFGTRIISKEGLTEQTHATHVTGTIIGSGVNLSAKGMAPKALATTWYFDFDDAEMASLAKPDQTGLLFSNHSYGVVTGWSKVNGVWKWFGDPSVSLDEDYRHGFYAETAQALDQLAYLSPYYTIVWAAGNDRAEAGDGTHPGDGNGGTGFDCIIPEATAKNIITVGAINKVLNYVNAASVTMSNFSSWGPTDDGRIKPDVVAGGVSVFSTSAVGSNQYASLSGTSMATPNATGSLVLIQELYNKLHGGKFMRASTLKALAIHTTKEAGSFAGPDYSYGWGLLDVEAAAKLLLKEDNENTFVKELTLNNNESFTLDMHSLASQKITATLCWTDPAGNPVQPALDPTTSMLINDLDIRIIDGSGNSVLPWILDPANPSFKATTGNNFRDNVEKIEFINPEAKKYTVVVTHKGQLLHGKQNFSLVITCRSSASLSKTYYWIGNTGNWNDGARWSLSSGGVSANAIPGIMDNVIFDENSFTGAAFRTVTLTADAACKKITWITDKPGGFALDDHTLNVGGNFSIAGKKFSIATKGVLKFSTAGNNAVDIHTGDLGKASLLFAGGNWTVSGKLSVEKLEVLHGDVNLKGLTCDIKSLNTLPGAALNISYAIIQGLQSSSWDETSSIACDSSVINISSSTAQFDWDQIQYNGKIMIKKGGKLLLVGSNTINEFDIEAGAELKLAAGSTQNLSELHLHGEENEMAGIQASANAFINFNRHQKLCFDFLDIKNITVTGSAKINAGIHSVITNSNNWLQKECDDILYADFVAANTCTNALTEFENKSTGDIISWSWNFGDAESVGNTSTKENGFHSYLTPGKYVITLTVFDNNASDSYSQELVIKPNDLQANSIVLNGASLFSFQQALGYQWYKDGEPLVESVSRSLSYDGVAGNYQVVITGKSCKIASPSFVVTGIEEVFEKLHVFPNPANDIFHIELPEGAHTPTQVILYDAMGRIVLLLHTSESKIAIDARNLIEGLYHVEVVSTSTVAREKIVIQR